MSDLEFWEERFGGSEYRFGTEPNAFLRAQATRLPNSGTALAVADGEGRNGVWLAEQGLAVLSIDFSPAALEKARALARARSVEVTFEQVDVLHWTWPEARFDVIAAIFVQFATPDERTRMFDGMRKALKPGGLLLLEGYRPQQLAYGTGGPRVAENLYTRELLEHAFAGFSTLEIHEHDSEIFEGSAHRGLSALIDLVGRR
jgi:SAM-dependent methyltransferase